MNIEYFILAALLYVTTLTTLVSNFMASLFKSYISVNIQVYVGYMDSFMNLICLYFQYSFAQKYFNKCCSKLYSCVFDRLDQHVTHSFSK